MISGRGGHRVLLQHPPDDGGLGPRTMPPPARGPGDPVPRTTQPPLLAQRGRPGDNGFRWDYLWAEVTPPAPIASTPSTGPRTPIPPIATYSPCPGRAPTSYGRTTAATEPRPGWRLDGLRDQRRVHRSRRRERVAGGQRAARPAALGSDRRAAPPLAGIRISRVVRGQSQLGSDSFPVASTVADEGSYPSAAHASS